MIGKAVASGVGAIGMGIASMPAYAAKGIWKAGAGGKGFLAGGVAGGIYGAASADPRADLGDTAVRALWGAGIGAVGGGIAGSMIGAGITKATPGIKGAAGKAKDAFNKMRGAADDIPMTAAEIKYAAKSKSKADRVMRNAARRKRHHAVIMRRRDRRDVYGPSLASRAGSRVKGAMGSSLSRVKNYKRNFMARHRTNRIYKNASRMLPNARRNAADMRRLGFGADVDKVRQYGPVAPVDTRPAGSVPWGMATDGPAGPGYGGVTSAPIINVNPPSPGVPMARPVAGGGWSGGPGIRPESTLVAAPPGNAAAVAADQGKRAGWAFRAAERGYDEVEQVLASRGLTGALGSRGRAVQGQSSLSGWAGGATSGSGRLAYPTMKSIRNKVRSGWSLTSAGL